MDALIDFLNTNVLRHLVQLKYLHLYGDQVTVSYLPERAALFSHGLGVNEWDTALYPDAQKILLPVAADETGAQALLACVREEIAGLTYIVFKFCDPDTKRVLTDAFPLQFVRCNLSYTTPAGAVFSADAEVVIGADLSDERLMDLYARNGYTAESVAHYFGGQTFTIYEGENPACSCITFQNFGDVWEIGALHTVESARKRGYARRVVQTALHHLLAKGHVPRYQAAAINIPSIQLAESLGLVQCLAFEHYVLKRFD